MRKSNGDKRPYLRPVTRIELSEQNIKWRLILLVVCLSIAAVALFTGVRELLKVEPGWQEIQISSKNPNCSSEFVLMYDFSDYGGSAVVANRELNQIYTEAVEKTYLLFSADVEDASVKNLHLVNRNYNKPVTVEPELYYALEQVQTAGNRSLYLAPAYVEYKRIFHCENEVEAAGFDPAFAEELRPYLQQIASFASNPEHIDLELLDNNQVCLKVSDAYLEFAVEQELETLLDFGWMKNAFIADYLAQVLTEAGYTSGYLSSYDGFTRNLDSRGNDYSVNFFHRAGTEILMPARIHYTGPQSIVFLRDFPMDELDRWRYYAYEDGRICSILLNPETGRPAASVSTLISLSEERSCSQLLLEMIPVFLSEEDAFMLGNALKTEGISHVWCKDGVVYYNSATAEPKLLDTGVSTGYTVKFVE